MWTIVDHAYVLIEKCGFLLPTSRDLNVIIGWIIWSIQMLTIKMVEKVLQCLNWNWFWLIGEYLGSEQVAAVVQYTDHAGSWKKLHKHADFILVVFF